MPGPINPITDGLLPGRLDRLEAVVEQLVESVAEERKHSRIFQSEMQDALKRIGKVSWPLVATIVFGIMSAGIGSTALVVTLGAMALSPIRSDIDMIHQSLNDHAARDGHAPAMIMHARSEERFETIATRIAAIENDVAANTEDLNSRAGKRFNADDWHRIEAQTIGPMREGMQATATAIAALEARSEEWQNARQERHDLEERVRRLETTDP